MNYNSNAVKNSENNAKITENPLDFHNYKNQRFLVINRVSSKNQEIPVICNFTNDFQRNLVAQIS